MILALVAMMVMTMSAGAQSETNYDANAFGRICNYLELTSDQVEPVRTALAQFGSSLQAFNELDDASKGYEAWDKIQSQHKARMKKLLSQKQYEKYVKTLDQTARNTEERIMEQIAASK